MKKEETKGDKKRGGKKKRKNSHVFWNGLLLSFVSLIGSFVALLHHY